MNRAFIAQKEACDKYSFVLSLYRKLAQLEKDLASANGVVQATKTSFEEEKLKYIKELEEEKEKAQADRLKYEAAIDQLQRELTGKGINKAGDIANKILLDDNEEQSPAYYMTVILNDLKEKRKEGESRAVRVECEQRLRMLENEHQGQMVGLKTQLKHVFNLDLQNLKLTYEHQLKQVKISMKKQEEELELLRGELVKKESEISLLRERKKHYENEKRMYYEQVDTLSKVFNLISL